MQRVHFIGIGGTGISAIALYLLEKGWPVSGSDLNSSRYFTVVTSRGAVTRLGHHPDLALQADLVVRSSAVKDDDPEVQAARTAGIPVVKRADFLPVLTAGQRVLAVAGSHGKTTTTGMMWRRPCATPRSTSAAPSAPAPSTSSAKGTGPCTTSSNSSCDA